MSKTFKAIAALLIFFAVYFLVSTLIFSIMVYLNGGSIFSITGWRAIAVAAFATGWGGFGGVYAGHAVLEKYLEPYPRRFVGITFIVLLGIWFIPMTLIYITGAIGILAGADIRVTMEDWLPEGEYYLAIVRAIVAVITTWILLVKRQ